MLITSHEKKFENIKKGIYISLKHQISNISFIGFLLAVAYSATIGGLSSLVGTAPNILVKGFADRLIQKYFFFIHIFYL
jgi:Na+/H+ antiporter NhaD/arsenite permease-like protein